jgi:hypothetical protein
MDFQAHCKWCTKNSNKRCQLHDLQGLNLERILAQVTAYLGLCAMSPELIIEATPPTYRGGNITTYLVLYR